MKPYVKDLYVKRGDTKEVFFRVRTRVWDEATSKWVAGDYRDLTGWSVASQIRSSKTAADPAATFTASITDQVATKGGVLLRLTPAATTALTIDKGVWDCQLTDTNNDVWTYIEGAVEVDGDVTRA